MKIEFEKINLLPLDMNKYANLNSQQSEILRLLQGSCSIYEIVQYFFRKGTLVSFYNIKLLLDRLLSEKSIINPEIYEYFDTNQIQRKGYFDNLAEKIFDTGKSKKTEKSNLVNIPFFRSLSQELLSIFIENSTLVDIPAGVTLCQEGVMQRSLLVLLAGQATVYKKDLNSQQQKQVVLGDSSLFGEVGFFLGEARSASVITDKPCQLLIIKYIPEIFEDLINSDKARKLQLRMWTINALLRSETFKNLPQECFDALIFAGNLKKIPPRKVICQQGEIGKSCYIIVQGKVEVRKDLNFIRYLEQGDSFGEIALVATGGLRTASIHSVTEVLVLEIDMTQFYKLLAENFLLALEFEKIAKNRLNSDLNS